MGAEQLYSLIMSWSESSRRSYFPEDYVYGVLGVFQINIPRMRDPNAVWQHFLYELDNYMETTDIKNETFLGKRIIGLSDRAYEFDLRKARDMVDVYQHLLEVKLA